MSSSLVRGEWHVSARLTLIYRLLDGLEIARQTATCKNIVVPKNADVRETRGLNPQHELSADLRSSTSDVIL